jgi:hypothetical protein
MKTNGGGEPPTLSSLSVLHVTPPTRLDDDDVFYLSTESLTRSVNPHLQMGRGSSNTSTTADSGKVTSLLTIQGSRLGAIHTHSSLVGRVKLDWVMGLSVG